MGIGLLAVGCDSSMVDADAPTQLLSVSPAGGAGRVAPTSDLVITFTHAMMPGMERYVALHRERVTGPTVAIRCAWSDGRRVLTCRPDAPLASATPYVIHVGGGMYDANGRPIGMERHGTSMGGRWAGGGMMGGQTPMMGSGWRHANGSYGMIFEFTTE